MTLVGCDLHTRKQQVAVLDTATGEMLERELEHAGDAVERFYAALPRPVTVGMRVWRSCTRRSASRAPRTLSGLTRHRTRHADSLSYPSPSSRTPATPTRLALSQR